MQSQGSGQRGNYVRFAKVVAFEEQRFASGFGKGVGEAIAKIEASGMASLAVIGECLTREECVLFSKRLDGNGGLAQQGLPQKNPLCARSGLENDGNLDKRGRRNSRRFSCHNRLVKDFRPRLAEQNSEKG